MSQLQMECAVIEVPDVIWEEVVSYTGDIRKCGRMMSKKDYKTLFEIFYRQKSGMFYLRTFSYKAFVNIPKSIRDEKFTGLAELRLFVSIDRLSALWLFIDKPFKVIVSKDMTFGKSSPNADTTCNTYDQFISFWLSFLVAKYFGNDARTDASPNLGNFLKD